MVTRRGEETPFSVTMLFVCCLLWFEDGPRVPLGGPPRKTRAQKNQPFPQAGPGAPERDPSLILAPLVAGTGSVPAPQTWEIMAHKPIVAVVGRPNVGKSTLFNRLVKARKAIVDDQPGVTRDRHYAEVQWGHREFMLMDTGGFVPEGKDLFGAGRARARLRHQRAAER